METFLKWVHSLGHFIHYLTGWIVHPSDGGCHAITKEELKAEIEKQFDKKQER